MFPAYVFLLIKSIQLQSRTFPIAKIFLISVFLNILYPLQVALFPSYQSQPFSVLLKCWVTLLPLYLLQEVFNILLCIFFILLNIKCLCLLKLSLSHTLCVSGTEIYILEGLGIERTASNHEQECHTLNKLTSCLLFSVLNNLV